MEHRVALRLEAKLEKHHPSPATSEAAGVGLLSWRLDCCVVRAFIMGLSVLVSVQKRNFKNVFKIHLSHSVEQKS